MGDEPAPALPNGLEAMAHLAESVVGARDDVEPSGLARALEEETAVPGRDHLVAIGLDHERAGNAGGRLGPLAAADLGDERGLGLLGIGARQVAQGSGGDRKSTRLNSR